MPDHSAKPVCSQSGHGGKCRVLGICTCAPVVEPQQAMPSITHSESVTPLTAELLAAHGSNMRAEGARAERQRIIEIIEGSEPRTVESRDAGTCHLDTAFEDWRDELIAAIKERR